MINKLIKIWCWIVGHDMICLKLHNVGKTQISSTSAHECVRCGEQWKGQWET